MIASFSSRSIKLSSFCHETDFSDKFNKTFHHFKSQLFTMSTIQYISSSRAQRTLLGLHAMYELQELCDVILETEDGLSVSVHRNVLAASSPYFRAMFTGRLAESSKEKIKLKDIEGKALQEVIEFMYTCSVSINDDNVESLLKTASVFQLIEIVNVCCEFLKEQLHPSNCLGIAALADRFSCEELLGEANKFTVKNFNEVVKFDEFKQLTLEEVKTLLLDENISVRSEEDVFQAAIDWLSVTSEQRSMYVTEVLGCVRLPILSPEYLTTNVIDNELLQGNDECQLMVKEAVEYALSPSSEKRKQGYVTRMQPRMPTGFADVLVAIGGLFSGEAVSSAERYNLYTDEWFTFPAMWTSRYGFAVTQVRGHIYCLGGYHSGQFLNTVESYNPEDDTWVVQKPMFTERKYFGAACLNGKIYAVGGSNGQERLKTVECYEPFLDQWTFMAPMLTPRMYHGVVALGGLLYAVGGHSGSNRLSTMECYDPQTDVWTPVSSMSKPRSVAGVAALNGILYVIGGFDGYNYLKDVECYNPQTDTWTFMPSLNRPRSAASVTVMKDRLFVLGGFNGQFLDSVEVFDPKVNEWNFVSNMSIPRVHFGVTVI